MMRFRVTLLAIITAILITGCSQQSHQPHGVSELAELRKPGIEERYISVDFLEEKTLFLYRMRISFQLKAGLITSIYFT
ncbi:hypothetical protein MGI18_20355 [Bacillus sp. OVS6]|nr:hypothetical protein MGI18_20355 [Bacillus sp. OVS6]